MPVWQWLSRDGAPVQRVTFEAALRLSAEGHPTIETAARTFQLAAAEAIDRIVTPVPGDDRQRALARIGPPSVVEDLRRNRRGAERPRSPGHPEQPAARLSAHLRRLADRLGDGRAQRPLAADAAVLPFALSLVMQRLAAPWQIIRLAIRMAASDDEIRVAATPYGVAVTIALHDLYYLAAMPADRHPARPFRRCRRATEDAA